MVEDSSESWLAFRAEVVDSIHAGTFSGREIMDLLEISAGTLGGWVWAERRLRARSSAPSFAEVTLVGAARGRERGVLVLLRGGRRLRVGPGFDGDEVARLVRVLESC